MNNVMVCLVLARGNGRVVFLFNLPCTYRIRKPRDWTFGRYVVNGKKLHVIVLYACHVSVLLWSNGEVVYTECFYTVMAIFLIIHKEVD